MEPQSFDINAKFLAAARLGNGTELKALFKLGANPEFEDLNDPFGATPLSEAVRCNRVSAAEVLINECFADVNHCVKHNMSPLYLAVDRGHTDLVRLLLSHGADPLVLEGFNDDSPLHVAAQRGRTQICQILIENHADPNGQNRTGDTPLHFAAAENNVTTCELLLQFGCDVTLANHGEQTAYDVATSGRFKTREAAEFLAERMDESQLTKEIERDLTNRGASPAANGFFDENNEDSMDYTRMSPVSVDYNDERKDDVFGGSYYEGWLEKQGHVRKGFLPRYCRIFADGMLKYYVRPEDDEPRGVVNVKDMLETMLLEYSGEAVFGFGIKTPERFWKFKCKSDRERREWIAVVHAVNYGISLHDFGQLNVEISRVENTNTYVYRLSRHSFLDRLAPMSILQAGWMYKLGAPITGFDRGSWRKRWITLQQDEHQCGFLSYRQRVESDPKGTIHFSDVRAIAKLPDSEAIRQRFRPPTTHCFKLVTDSRTWVFACSSEQELFMWMGKISEMSQIEYRADTPDDDEADEGTLTKLMRKISDVPEWMGFKEEYVPMSSVQPKIGGVPDPMEWTTSPRSMPADSLEQATGVDLAGAL